MPLAGAVGAVHAANRRVRSRQGNGLGRSNSINRAPVTPPRNSKASVVPAAAPALNTSGMLATLKSKVGVFQKQKQALAEKMHKGLALTGMTSGMKKASGAGAGNAVAGQVSQHAIDPALVAAIGEMGFDEAQIQKAAAIVGPNPEDTENLLQVLLTMQDANDPAPADEAPARRADSMAAESQPVPAATQPPALATQPPPSSTQPIPTQPTASPCTSAESDTAKDLSKAVATGKPELAESSAPTPLPLLSMAACGSAEFESVVDRSTRDQAKIAAPDPQPRALSASAFAHLRRMGFASEAIQQATAMLGSNSNIDDLFDILIAMGTPISPQHSSTAASSSDPIPAAARAGGERFAAAAAAPKDGKVDLVPNAAEPVAEQLPEDCMSVGVHDATEPVIEVMQPEEVADFVSRDIAAAVLAELGEEAQKADCSQDSRSDAADLVCDVEQDAVDMVDDADGMIEAPTAPEVPVRVLAAAVVASVIATASSKVASTQQEAASMKCQATDRLAASPVRGGA